MALPWVGVSFAGWSLAGGTAYLADSLPRTAPLLGITGAIAYLAVTALGGLVLGAVTSPALGLLLGERQASPADAAAAVSWSSPREGSREGFRGRHSTPHFPPIIVRRHLSATIQG